MRGLKLLLDANQVVLDSETTGLYRGAGVGEVAVYDVGTQTVHEFINRTAPTMAQAKVTNPFQDSTRLASSVQDVMVLKKFETWKDLLIAQTAMQYGEEPKSWEDTLKKIKQENQFLYRMVTEGKYAWLNDKPESVESLREREQQFKKIAGVKMAPSTEMGMRELLGKHSPLERLLRGKTIWIANANFESKQFGAQIAAHGEVAKDFAKRLNIETRSVSSEDPFYVTGVEVNKARMIARRSGDWRGVWKAYLGGVPKTGETAVRDIQDVIRAVMSYGNSMGIINVDKGAYFGAGIDLSAQLMARAGASVGDPASKRMLGQKELHRAAEDAAIHEEFVRVKSIMYASALQEAQEGTEVGKFLIEEAKQGRGALLEAQRYLGMSQEVAGDIVRSNLLKRFERAQQDIFSEGISVQQTGIEKVIMKTVETPQGADKMPIGLYGRKDFQTMRGVVDHIKAEGIYSQFNVDVEEEYAKFAASYEEVQGKEAQRLAMNQYVQQQSDYYSVENIVARKEDKVRARGKEAFMGYKPDLPRTAATAEQLLDFSSMPPMKAGILKGAGAAGAALTVLGGVLSMAAGNREEPRYASDSSVVALDYQQWLNHQNQFYGTRENVPNEGLTKQGIANDTRRKNTDFASPYQGMQASAQVFIDQELLREREKLLRESYGARHYDPDNGVFAPLGMFGQGIFRGGYSYLSDGTPVSPNAFGGLRGQNLRVLDLSKGYKIHVEDADTITVQRGGVVGAVSNFFGMNKSYKFRLAGIDSTETSHGSTSYHAPQPYAEEAKAALRSLIAGSSDVQLVYDEENTTYGRMMGAVIADGKNLNFEVVKRGVAAHLPFGKRSESMIDYERLSKVERIAYQAKRGLWSQPWARAFYDFSEASGNRVTFNTLASKSRIAKNTALMDQLTVMEHAQSMGMYSNAHAIMAAKIGGDYDMGDDDMAPRTWAKNRTAHQLKYSNQLHDQTTFMQTKGTGYNKNKFSTKGGYGNLNRSLTLDSMSHSDTIWSKRSFEVYEQYRTKEQLKYERKARQAAMQRQINQQFGNSPIGHHRM